MHKKTPRPKQDSLRFYHRLSWQIGLVFLLMLLGMATISLIAYQRLNGFEDSAIINAERYVPDFDTLSDLQLNITQLAVLSQQLSSSKSSAQHRITTQDATDLVNVILGKLQKINDRQAVEKLSELLADLIPGIHELAKCNANLLQVSQNLQGQLNNMQIFFNSKSPMTNPLLNKSPNLGHIWHALFRTIFDLSTQKRVFEIEQAEARLQAILSELTTYQDQLPPAERTFLLKTLAGSQSGILVLIAQRERYRNKIVGVETQNNILMENSIKEINRVFDRAKDDLSGQAKQMVVEAQVALSRLYLIIGLSLLLALVLYLGLKTRLFNSINMLREFLESDFAPSDALQKFDERNEIGRVVGQLKQYLLTIETQQATISQVSDQLAAVIKHSNLRVAVVYGEQVLYCNDYFSEIFSKNTLEFIEDLPKKLHILDSRKITFDSVNSNKVILAAYKPSSVEQYFDVVCAPINWQNKNAMLVSFVDVTEREQATKTYLKTLSVVEEEAYKDALTGLYNRKKFDDMMSALAVGGAAAEFAILVCDIDLFKDYNDALGHLQGDKALQLVAKSLAEIIPTEGVVIRYGGEEFVVILTGAHSAQAVDIGEKVMRQMTLLAIPHPSFRCDYLSLSVGVALSSQALDPLACFALADKRLYEAKYQGRNRMVSVE